MPFALSIIGLLLIITGYQGTSKQFGKQLVSDFTGPGNFVFWIASIGILSLIGNIKKLEPLSRAMMVLVVLAMFLSNKGFFAKLLPSITAGTKDAPLPAGGSLPVGGSSGSDNSSGGGSGGSSDSGSSDYVQYAELALLLL